MEVRHGEIHALVGANGAGKSTLCKIIAGLTTASRGSMILGDQPYEPSTKQKAESVGVQIVQQELNLIATLSVAENLLLSRLPNFAGLIRQRQLAAAARQALDRFGLQDIGTNTIVGTLGVGRQQMVEIAAALDRDCRLLILDEPTAALSPEETKRLFECLRTLRRRGIGMIYISHRLDEVAALSDRVTVMRDGRRVGVYETDNLTTDEMVDLMSGQTTGGSTDHRSFASDAVAMRVRGIRSSVVQTASFDVHRGERLGIAGLVGSGRTELLRLIFGADRAIGGTVQISDRPPTLFRHPCEAVAAGLAMVTEDRKDNGLLLKQPIRGNITIGSLWQRFCRMGMLRWQHEREVSGRMIEDLDIRCRGGQQLVQTLSGGNQQKVAIAKWLVRGAEVYLFDEPTRGIDVPARRRIYQLIDTLAKAGKAVIIVSSDLDELMQTCDRIGVMSRGRWMGDFSRRLFRRRSNHAGRFRGAAAGLGRMIGNHSRQLVLRYGGLIAALTALILYFGFKTDSFFQIGTARLIANQIPELTLLSMGLTLVLVIGRIDLSVGSVMALSGAVAGVLMTRYQWSLVAAVLASLASGAGCGLLTGAISIGFRIPSFIVSLGMLEIARGATRRLLDSNTLVIGSEIAVISEPVAGWGISPAFLVAMAAVLGVQLLLTSTVFGRYCIAIGTNDEAVRMSGIRTAPYALGVFVLSGLLCGLAGLAPTSLMEAADPGVGIGIELSAIAACVIGGTSLMGGRGDAISTFLGVLLIAVLQTGLSRMSVDDANKQIVTGVVIIIAVLIDTVRGRPSNQ